MTDLTPAPAERSTVARSLRRIAGASLLALIVFGVLWYTVFSAVTSAIVASGGAVVLVAGSSMSETFQSIFETISEFVLGIFGAIADFFANLFDF